MIAKRLELHGGHLGRYDASRMAALIVWCANPDPDPGVLESILNRLSNDDCIHLACYHEGPAARVGWLEIGRRKNYVDFEVHLIVSEDQVALRYEGAGQPLAALSFRMESLSDD